MIAIWGSEQAKSCVNQVQVYDDNASRIALDNETES